MFELLAFSKTVISLNSLVTILRIKNRGSPIVLTDFGAKGNHTNEKNYQLRTAGK